MTIAAVGVPAKQAVRPSMRSDDRQQSFGRLMQSLEKDMWQGAAAGPQNADSAGGMAGYDAGKKNVFNAISEAAHTGHGVDVVMPAPIQEGEARQQGKGAARGATLERVGSESEEPHAKTLLSLVRTCESPCLTPVDSPFTMDVAHVRLIAAFGQGTTDVDSARETLSRPLFDVARHCEATNVIRVEVFDGNISVYLQSPIQHATAALKRELLAEIHRQGLTCRRLVINADAANFTAIKELDHAC